MKKKVSDLAIGDSVLMRDGKAVKIASISLGKTEIAINGQPVATGDEYSIEYVDGGFSTYWGDEELQVI